MPLKAMVDMEWWAIECELHLHENGSGTIGKDIAIPMDSYAITGWIGHAFRLLPSQLCSPETKSDTDSWAIECHSNTIEKWLHRDRERT